MKEEITISYEAVLDAHEKIKEYITRTPLVRLPWLDTEDRRVWGKFENNQETGSFKFRGAVNAVLKAPNDIKIVTASAGNHGLAIAAVCQKFDRHCTIYVPANASEAKITRLQNMNADVSLHGRDLKEATKQARLEDGYFISPFSHPDVMAGQGSLAIEILDQHSKRFDNVLVPLGGGGLLAGVATVFNKHSPNTKITALHPAVFQRTSLSMTNGSGFYKPVFPTVADGLAVQHTGEDHTHRFVANLMSEIEHISEEDMYIAIATMLQNESQLVEGAGAIGIAALLNDLDGERYKGDILTLICGGNISSTSLMKAMAVHATNKKVARLAGNQGAILSAEAKRNSRTIINGNGSLAKSYADYNFSNFWRSILSGYEEDLEKLKQDVDRHKEFVETENLELNLHGVKLVNERVKLIDEMLAEASLPDQNNSEIRDQFRLLIQEYANARSLMAWCSPSTDHSLEVQFFDPAEVSSGGVNYDRYGSVLLRERERNLLSSLGHDSDKVDLLLTSSGQASFTTVLNYLLSEQLPQNATIISCPYIYFEAQELMENQKGIKYRVCDSWDVRDMVAMVEAERAEVLFIDPLANIGDMPVIDFKEFAKALEGRDWSKKWIVTDGTMISGGTNPFSTLNKPNHPNIIYYESGSKYLGLGLDIQMAGVIVISKNIADKMATYRRNAGAVMYQKNVLNMPKYNREQFLTRMKRLTENAEIMYNALSRHDPDGKLYTPSYPVRWEELGWEHGGGVVSVVINDEGMNTRQSLEYLVDLILEECKNSRVKITKGVSFGFSTTRVSAAAAMANDMPPFLRFSIGEEEHEEILRLTEAVTAALDTYFYTYTPDKVTHIEHMSTLPSPTFE